MHTEIDFGTVPIPPIPSGGVETVDEPINEEQPVFKPLDEFIPFAEQLSLLNQAFEDAQATARMEIEGSADAIKADLKGTFAEALEAEIQAAGDVMVCQLEPIIKRIDEVGGKAATEAEAVLKHHREEVQKIAQALQKEGFKGVMLETKVLFFSLGILATLGAQHLYQKGILHWLLSKL